MDIAGCERVVVLGLPLLVVAPVVVAAVLLAAAVVGLLVALLTPNE